MKITTRNGKKLDVGLTLLMAQDHIRMCDAEDPDDMNFSVQRGLALALEAALLELQKRK